MSGLRALRSTPWSDGPDEVDPRDDCELMRYCFKGSGGGTTTNVTNMTNDLPEYIRPYYQAGLAAAEADILERPTDFFGGQTYANSAPETEAALNVQTNRARAGSPLLDRAQGYTSDVLSGQYLSPDSNPYMGQIADAVRSEVVPAVSSGFGGAGRTGGSPLETEAISKGVSRGMSPYMFQEYGRERGAMEAAAGRAPGLAAADYTDIAQLGLVGQAREGQAQLGINEAISRQSFGENEPTNRILQYMSALQGVPVGLNQTGTNTGTQRNNVNGGMWAAGTALQAAGK
ncbi:MAG: hypothetical protein ACTSU0_11830 [Alphaproteobacteria bacterium]